MSLLFFLTTINSLSLIIKKKKKKKKRMKKFDKLTSSVIRERKKVVLALGFGFGQASPNKPSSKHTHPNYHFSSWIPSSFFILLI